MMINHFGKYKKLAGSSLLCKTSFNNDRFEDKA